MQTTIDEMSLFSNPIKNVIPKETISIHKLYSLVSEGRFAPLTEDVRLGIKKKNDDLPYITPSGVFTKRSNNCLVSYSGIICIDLDDKDINLKYTIINDPFLNPVLIFVSPSGNGLKIFIRIQGAEASKHLDYWLAIKQHFIEKYQIDVDKSCKDVSRACFLCHDPDALFSPFGSVSAEALLSQFPPDVQTLPVQTLPVQTLPVETLPVQTMPVQALPVQTLPVQTMPVQALPVQTLPVQTLPVQTMPVQTMPVQALPVQTLPVQTLPVQTLPVETLPVETLPVETLHATSLPACNSPKIREIPTPGSLGSPDSHLDRTDVVNLLNTSMPVFSYAQNLLVRNGWRQNKEKFLRPGSKGSGNDLSAVFAVPPGYTIPVFYNFSDNGHPFEPNKGYSPVQVISILEYNENFKDCITALKAQFSYLLPTSLNPQNHENHNPSPSHSSHILTLSPSHIPALPPSPSAPYNPLFFREKFYKDLLYAGQEKKDRKQIIGPFLYQDTTSLFFSRTNYGKSIMAFQFAYHAATGTDFEPGSFLSNQCDPMMVVVVDLELDEKAHYDRHKKLLEDPHPLLNKNLLYLHEKIENNMVLGFDLLKRIEEAAIKNKAELLVIDNISKLLPDALRPEIASMTISMLNSVRIITGASILIIGHTTKGNPNICVQPTDYYGSAMIQNFFNELFYLDKTKDGKFFLSQSKTKFADCYDTTVPVFTRGEHHRFGLGFTYCHLANIADIRLPYSLESAKTSRPRNLSDFKKEIETLLKNGFTQAEVAKLCDVNQSSINRLLSKINA